MNINYKEAVRYFNNKDYKSAEDILINLKEREKNNAEVLYFLAVVKSIIGDYKGAENLYKEVIGLNPDHPEAYYNLALCLQNLNESQEALEYYKKALELNPFLSQAYNNMAMIYKDTARYDEAEDAFRKALKAKPDSNNAISELSGSTIEKDSSPENLKVLEFIKKEDFKGAEELLIDLIEKEPENRSFLRSLGIVYFNLKKYEKASSYFKKLIELNEDDFDSIYNLGVCFQYSEDNENALKYYKKAIELRPNNVEVLNNLGLIYAGLKKYDEAEKHYNLALKNNPEYTNTLINLGGIKLNNDNYDEAMEIYKKALSIFLKKDQKKHNSMVYTNIGMVHYKLKDMDEALKNFNMAIENDPNNVIVRYNKAEALLITEQYEEGWKEYEWRVERKEFGKRKSKLSFNLKDDLKGKRILIYAEQGLGDAIQFVRYLPMLKEKGCYIIFECDKEMHNLLHGFEGIDEIIERNITKTPDIYFDYEIPLLSLPLFFYTNSKSIPAQIPYLHSDPNLKELWSREINNANKIKAGIVWAGNPIHTNDRHRSVRLQQMASVFSIEGIDFYSIQKGIPEIQVKDYQLLIKELGSGIKSFADTAAIIDNLDLIITVDTAVAHLSGALGKETWVLLPYVPDWRWLLEGERTQWYPTIKLYRQPALKDWESVITLVKKDLIEFVKNKGLTKSVISDKSDNQPNLYKSDKTFYLGLTSGDNFGWGVCSKYLKKELSQRLNIINFDEHPEIVNSGKVNGPVFHALNNNDFSGLFPVRGTKNIGYTFFEYELSEAAIKNAANYDLVLGGSSWNEKKLRERGVSNTGVLIQGIDPELFYPSDRETKRDLFIIFSGGKFELRKGQDLALKAIKVLQQKYRDIVLINAWYNMWPSTMQSMGMSKHIKYEYKGETWKNFMINLCTINGIDGDKVFTLPITPNNKLRDLYLSTDIGLFPNRCEGGTNLVLMEYMACGKPVIASYTSGHTDILTEENSVPLKNLHQFKLHDDNKNLIANWEEPDIDEIIDKLEYAYFNREKIKQIGKRAGEFMKNFTWEASAERLMKFLRY